MAAYHIYAFADEASPLLTEQIIAMKRNGLDGLEIRTVDHENISYISLDKAKEINRQMTDAGLKIWSIGSPIGKIDIEKDDYSKHLDALRHTCEIAREMNCENIRMFSFYIPQGKAKSLYKNQVMDHLHEMVSIASTFQVSLCHENEKGIYGDMADSCLEILTEVPDLCGVFDPANFVQCGQETMSAWHMLKSRIKYLHIKDALFADGSVVPAGRGEGHVPEIVRAFLNQGGKDMTVEPHLKVFDGLKALERPGEESRLEGKFVFSTNGEAFDAACSALKEILAH